jgi:anti-anti-sigma regulatory factor
MTQRRVRLILIGSLVVISAALCGYFILTGSSVTSIIPTGAAALLCSALFIAYWRGWEPATKVVTLIVAAAVMGGTPGDSVNIAAVLPAIFALALVDWRWVAGVGAAVLLVLMAKGNFQGAYTSLTALFTYLPTVGAAVLGGMVLDEQRLTAERNARQAEQARAMADARADEISQQTTLLNEQNGRLRELLSLVSSLETPAVSIAPAVLLAPLVGKLDGQRGEQLTRRLLEQVHGRQIRLVILDIAGVLQVDATATAAVSGIMRALRLLGCEVVLTGISADAAAALVTEGAHLGELAVAASPEDALSRYWAQASAAA